MQAGIIPSDWWWNDFKPESHTETGYYVLSSIGRHLRICSKLSDIFNLHTWLNPEGKRGKRDKSEKKPQDKRRVKNVVAVSFGNTTTCLVNSDF